MSKKKTGKESQYIVSCPRPGSDPPFGSDRESGCDRCCSSYPYFRQVVIGNLVFKSLFC